MQETVIRSKPKYKLLGLDEIWGYRYLLFQLSFRDFKVRFAQTLLGLGWVVIQPLFTMAIFTFIFDYYLGIEAPEGIPYPIFAFSGIMAWQYFSFVVTHSSQSLISAQSIIKKVFFPRILIPVSKSLVGLFDLIAAILVFFILALTYQTALSWNIVLLPLFFILIIVSSLSVGIWLAALSVRYRDIQRITPFIIQLGLYITPVAYPSPPLGDFKIIYYLNPMAGIIEGIRWCLFDTPFPGLSLTVSITITFIILVSGLFYFKKTENKMADLL
jgi:lipopolysaccharide transport system permease protein